MVMKYEFEFEELETVEELTEDGWLELGVGAVIGGAAGVVLYVAIAT